MRAWYEKIKSQKVLDSFNEKISSYTRSIFGSKFNAKELTLQILECYGEDKDDPNTILHIDRFLPSIKMFYYPFEIKAGLSPYGYIPKTSLIDPLYIKACSEAYGLVENKKPPFRLPEWYHKTAPVEEKVYVPGNTLIIGATHGLHRRVPFEMKGKRYSIRILFTYSEITKWKLLKNLIG